MTGPLEGIRIIEFAGIGPAPFCGMLLSDMGADVVRIDRKGATGSDRFDVNMRGRRSIALDLKHPAGVAACLDLIGHADALIEGFRPGVMERLGLGPELALARNPRLIYGRMTGWGQTGPYAKAAGHDINYIALSGALHATGAAERPAIPLNLVGDYGGGALYLAMGILAALLHARTTGEGQVIDCAMADGAISMMGIFYGEFARGTWADRRESNIIDGAAPFYNTYECADGQFVAIGSIEPGFYALLLEKAGLDAAEFMPEHDQSQWPARREMLAAVFRRHTRAEWCALMEGTDVCFAPVLGLAEAPEHPQNRAREAFVTVEGVVQPAPQPHFSRTPGTVQRPPPAAGEHSETALADWGFSAAEIAALRQAGAL